MCKLKEISQIAAYQRLSLLDIQRIYDEITVDLNQHLKKEQDTSDELDFLEKEFAKFIELSEITDIELSYDGDFEKDSESIRLSTKNYSHLEVFKTDNFDELVKKSELYLKEKYFDLRSDPLLQILNSREISEIFHTHKQKYGDVGWEKSDYVVVILAGFLATLLDICLVKIPRDTNFFGNLQTGSPLTKWIENNSSQIYESYLKPLESIAKVPYDAATDRVLDRNVKGMNPHFHRLMSLGHDPVLGFIIGVLDIVSGGGTFIDKFGNLIIAKNLSATPDNNFFSAFIKVFLHLLSDVFTKAGIPPPFFTLLQLVKAKSPFVLGKSGETVSWTNVARYMYRHGYDLRHFLTMGIVPASIEIIIRGYWLLRNFEDGNNGHLSKVKMTSMLMLGHTIALSGNLIKTGLIYQMNPLALNWAQILRWIPLLITWIKESTEREKLLRIQLDNEWVSLYQNIAA